MVERVGDEKGILKLKHYSCVQRVDIDNKVDIIYSVCAIESRKVSQKKTTKVV